jgi:predicted permease
MPLLPRLSSLWRNLFRRTQKEQELSEELDAYLELLTEQKRDAGLSAEAARRAALLELGGREQVKEQVREVRMGHWLETVLQDARYALRVIRRKPGFAAVAVLSLAMGIGANTAIFSIVDAVLLKMLPVREPERLVLFKSLAREEFSYGAFNGDRQTDPATGLQAAYVFPPQSFARLREQAQTPESTCAELFAFGRTDANVTIDGQAESLGGLVVSGNYYQGLGVQPILGRLISEHDDEAGASPVVVFTHRYWERRFNSDPAVIGKQISINGVTFTIIGVTPRGFDGTGQIGSAPSVFVPLAAETQINPERKRMIAAGWWWLRLMARLKPNAAMEQTRAQLEAVFQQSVVEQRSARQAQPLRSGRAPLPNLEPKDYPLLAVDSGSQGELETRRTLAPRLYLLFGVVGLVLLIACANVANLLLARAAARQREIALRLALGAGRSRLLRQLLTESVLLSLLGALCGIVVAIWIKDVLLAVSAWGGAEMEALRPQLDLRVLGFAVLLSLVTAGLFGLVPALRATSVDLTPSLRDMGRNSSGIARSWLSKGLVITQVSLSFLLLAGAGLMLRTLHNLQTTGAGFNRQNLLLFTVMPGQLGYKGERLASLYRRLLAELDSVPGARGVTCSSEALLSTGYWTSDIFVEGAPVARNADNQPIESGIAMMLGVRENFLETMGISLLQGRTLSSRDDERAPRVAVVNQAFAKQFFPAENPIGKRFGFEAGTASQIEIVGLSADAKYSSLRDEIQPTIYFAWSQDVSQFRFMVFEIRAAGDPGLLAGAVREVVHGVESNLPVTDLKTQVEQSDETMRTERLSARLFSFFGALALLLAGIGLYGVLAYAVAQRTQEIGIRLALGAKRRDVLRLVTGQGILLAVLGVIIGLAGAVGSTRLLQTMLYGVRPTDPLTFAVIAGVLLLVALLACWIPARRAARVDPLVALRCE